MSPRSEITTDGDGDGDEEITLRALRKKKTATLGGTQGAAISVSAMNDHVKNKLVAKGEKGLCLLFVTVVVVGLMLILGFVSCEQTNSIQ